MSDCRMINGGHKGSTLGVRLVPERREASLGFEAFSETMPLSHQTSLGEGSQEDCPMLRKKRTFQLLALTNMCHGDLVPRKS